MYIRKVFIIISMATVILIAGCHSHITNRRPAYDTIYKYQLEYTIPDIMGDGREFVLRQQGEAMENNKYTLYRYPYFYSLEKDHVILKNETRYRVLVFKKGENFGDFYEDDSVGNVAKVVNVDSILKQTIFSGSDIYDSAIYWLSKVSIGEEGMTQIFTAKRKMSDSDCDSAVAYYSKRAIGIGYSLSKTLDTNSQCKLYKVCVICPGYYSEKHKIQVPKRIITLELKKNDDLKLADEQYFLEYIRRLENGR